ETRCGAVFPGDSTPVLTRRADCSLFTSKPAHMSPYLPGMKKGMRETLFANRQTATVNNSGSSLFPTDCSTSSHLFYHPARYSYSQISPYSEQKPIFESDLLQSLLQCNMTNPGHNERHKKWPESKGITKIVPKCIENVGD